MKLTQWHRDVAAGIAAAHPLTPTAPILAKGNHLVSQNDEPELRLAVTDKGEFTEEAREAIDAAVQVDKKRNRYDSHREEVAMHEEAQRRSWVRG